MGKDAPLKRVFLGISVVSMNKDMRQGTQEKLEVYDRLQHPGKKLTYLCSSAQSGEEWKYLFYPARVDNLLEIKEIKENILYKCSKEYRKGKSPRRRYQYYGKGQEAYKKKYKGNFRQGDITELELWKEEKIQKDNEEVLKEICQLCKEQEVELNLVIFPTTEDYRRSVGSTEEIHEYFGHLADEWGIRLYDFQSLSDVKERFPDSLFQDRKHLNLEGSRVFTRMLGEWYLEGVPPT